MTQTTGANWEQVQAEALAAGLGFYRQEKLFAGLPAVAMAGIMFVDCELGAADALVAVREIIAAIALGNAVTELGAVAEAVTGAGCSQVGG